MVKEDGKFLFKGTMTYEESVDTLSDMNLCGGIGYTFAPNRMVYVLVLSYNKTYVNQDHLSFNKPVIVRLIDAETGKLINERLIPQDKVDFSKIKDAD